MNAFGDAVATSDEDALKALLGADFRTLIPPVGAEGRYRFLAAWAKSHAIKPEGDAKALIAVGDDGWTLPIPIVKTAQGWRFDTRAGVDEMRVRRIGRNELAVMQVMLAIYDAQKEYAQEGPQRRRRAPVRVQVRELARASRTGCTGRPRRARRRARSGPAVDSRARSCRGSAAGLLRLPLQAPHRPRARTRRAARSTTSRSDRMIGGFAVVAWPVKYGDTGVMTFMVSHDGVLYEKDLGPDTAAQARAMTRFDPDSTGRRSRPDK